MLIRWTLYTALGSLLFPAQSSAQENYLIPPIHKNCTEIKDPLQASECTRLALTEEVTKHLVYPQQAIDQSIEGRVFVAFVVQEDGRIDEKSVMLANNKNAHPILAKEAIRGVKLLTPMQPALLDLNGTVTSAKYILPIRFNLEKK